MLAYPFLVCVCACCFLSMMIMCYTRAYGIVEDAVEDLLS